MSRISRIERLEKFAGAGDPYAVLSDEELSRRIVATWWNLANIPGQDPELVALAQSAADALGVPIESLTAEDLRPNPPPSRDVWDKYKHMDDAELMRLARADLQKSIDLMRDNSWARM